MWLLVLMMSVAQAMGPVLFIDDFDRGIKTDLPGWRISNNVGVSMERGVLVMGKDASIVIDAHGAKEWTDYTVVLRFRVTEMDERSQFIVRVRSHLGRFNVITSQDIYIVPWTGEIWVLTQRPKGGPDDIDADSLFTERGNIKQEIELEEWYLLTIETLDNKYRVSLDNRMLLQYSDPETSAGYVRLSIGHFGTTEVELDYIKVIQEGISVPTTWGRLKKPF